MSRQNRFEKQLRDRKTVLLGEVHDALLRIDAERYAEVAAQVRDTKDQAAIESLAEISHAEVERDLGEVRDIDAALQRIAAGTYGTCVTCGAQIAQKRLEAYPTAKRCLHCQQSHERGRTQSLI